ncbi:MAG: TRAP transporter permease [Candidatus Tectomicrobia bacterium]|uniref:TRAP transporter permease n=1 Tax=Tectimicrobiota bacterium TaxID=2528274 RepID=A0A932MKV3_UNCTE|nr:TRAP transporter permease [Candidatus Tectomicrobia bacterium]
MRKHLARFCVVVSVSLSLFHLYTGYFGVLVALLQRSVHLLLTMVLVFLLYPASKRHENHPAVVALDVLLALGSVVCIGYVAGNYDYVVNREGLASAVSGGELALGLATFALILEGLRRVAGWPLVLVTLGALLYTWGGPYLPGLLAHRGWSWNLIVAAMYLDQEAIFGVPLGVSATYAALFILFGSFLNITGAGRFFIDLACSVAGGSRGGPAKIAVLSSALFGSVSGSPVANVYGTGSFTIPMMMRLGYRPAFAAAVEAAASTGGAIMPPVMGAVAFLMADITGIPYASIALSAALPAILYYFAVGLMVHYEAIRADLKGLPPEDIPSGRKVLANLYLAIPLVGLVYTLSAGYTAFRAAFIAVVLSVAVSFLRKETRLTPAKAIEALDKGGRDMILIALTTAASGIIIGTVGLTGLALRFTSLVLSFSDAGLIFPLVLTMVACLILGMGMPAAPAYIIVAALAIPSLIQLGVSTLAAHMFAFYFAVLSNVTPPVAMAAYAGASIAGSPMLRTGVIASKLAFTGFLIPFLFVYGPPLLLKGSVPEILWASLTAILGVVCLASGLQGWMLGPVSWLERPILIVSAVALIKPGVVTDGIGLGGFALILVLQWARFKKRRVPASPLSAREDSGQIGGSR